MDLVIVESPAKAKTINKYLGDNYIVLSSVGHIRDLHHDSFSLDEKLNPIYTLLEDKQWVVNKLIQTAKEANEIYLMTDADREGEAISFHLREVLKLKQGQYKRCVFKEITKSAIQRAINNCREIDMPMVRAQEARRVLDRIIGYTVSPIMAGLYSAPSTGRVQTVATQLIVDRQLEIMSFRKKPYFDITLIFKDKNYNWTAKLELDNLIRSNQFSDEIVQFDDSDKWRLTSPAFAHALEVNLFKSQNVTVSNASKSAKRRSPPPPFTTSSLLQSAATKLGFSSVQTMSVAQKLYESGLITYMRTDEPNLEPEGIQLVRAAILSLQKTNSETLTKSLLPATPNKFPTPDNAQEGHEGIRPTSMNTQSSQIKDADGAALYDLIWRRTMACQMTDMEYDLTEIELRSTIKIKGENLYFSAKGKAQTFAGFMLVYNEEDDSEDVEANLPMVSNGDTLNITRVDRSAKYTRPPPHYTEPTFIKELERREIARPATYASTIGTIIKREYVLRKGKNLEASKLAMNYIKNIRDAFTFVDYSYTASSESKLDKIASGQLTYEQFIYSENTTLNNDIKIFSHKHDTAFKKCKECEEFSLIQHKSKNDKSMKYWLCYKCKASLPDKDGKPNYEYSPPAESEHSCPRCEKKKLIIYGKNTEKQQRWFACPDKKNCNTIIPSLAGTWDSDNPLPDINLWQQNHVYPCPKCKTKKVNNFLRLGKRDPQKNYRTYFCEDSKCETFVRCTEDSWNTDEPKPDFKAYDNNHSHICPKCKRNHLNLSKNKTSWYCVGDHCKTFLSNIQDPSLNNTPNFKEYEEKLASIISCPNCKKGDLIHSTKNGNFFCSDKCGVFLFESDDKSKPDLIEYNSRPKCIVNNCDGHLHLNQNKDKYVCSSKSCKITMLLREDGTPDIEEYEREIAQLRACPECSEIKMKLSRGSVDKKPIYYCTSTICSSGKFTTYVKPDAHGEPDYNNYKIEKEKRLNKNN